MAISLKDKIATLSPDKIAKNRAMGGELRLVAEFPNRQPLVLRGLERWPQLFKQTLSIYK